MSALILSVQGVFPKWHTTCFIAPNATIVGDVEMGENCSVWFNAVLRGDVNFIKIGNQVNIQDGAIIHGTYQRAGTSIGNNVSVGHRALIHGCTIHDDVLVGMGAIIMDNAVIHKNSIIAAGAVVLANTIVESGTIYAGVPAKKVKDTSPEMFKNEVQRIANNYILYSSWFKKN